MKERYIMNITKYNLKLQGKNHHPVLVTEFSTNYCSTNTVSSPENIVCMMRTICDMANLAEEYVYVVGMDSVSHILGIFEVAHGTGVQCNTSPREIGIRLLLCAATGFILLHNHPSGNTTPSHADICFTNRISKAMDMLGIPLLDHIIIGHDFFSFKENGLLKEG